MERPLSVPGDGDKAILPGRLFRSSCQPFMGPVSPSRVVWVTSHKGIPFPLLLFQEGETRPDPDICAPGQSLCHREVIGSSAGWGGAGGFLRKMVWAGLGEIGTSLGIAYCLWRGIDE